MLPQEIVDIVHVELKHPVSKTHIINMSSEDMKLFLEMINAGY